MGAVTARSRDDTTELRAALALSRQFGLGPVRVHRMVKAKGSFQVALSAFRRGEETPQEPGGRSLPPLDDDVRRALRRLEPAPAASLEGLQARGIRLVRHGGPGYPARLEHLRDPPIVLFLEGPADPDADRAVTIVGTRAATEYGRRMARDLGAGLARRGWAVVSGMARGIDAAAHRGALDADGMTVGVLGGGLRLDRSGGRLYEAMRRGAVLVSEAEPGTEPRKGSFPRRNRILAALSRAVVVVQAGIRSGAMITVRHALDLGREVLAVPGPVGPAASEGVHQLLREGAALAEGPRDVLRTLGMEGDPTLLDEPADGAPGAHPGPAGRVLARLAEGPASFDELAALLRLPATDVLALLSRLEVTAQVERLPGSRYARPAPRRRVGLGRGTSSPSVTGG